MSSGRARMALPPPTRPRRRRAAGPGAGCGAWNKGRGPADSAGPRVMGPRMRGLWVGLGPDRSDSAGHGEVLLGAMEGAQAIANALESGRAHGFDRVALVPHQVRAQPHAQFGEARQQIEPRWALDLAHRASDALRRTQPDQRVNVLGRHGSFEQLESAFIAGLLNQLAQRERVALLEHRTPPARAPGDEVVELTRVHRLPPPHQLFPHLGSQIVLHGRSSFVPPRRLHVRAVAPPNNRELAPPWMPRAARPWRAAFAARPVAGPRLVVPASGPAMLLTRVSAPGFGALRSPRPGCETSRRAPGSVLPRSAGSADSPPPVRGGFHWAGST